MSAPSTNVGWRFDPGLNSGARAGGHVARAAFKPDLDTFIREVLQNACDAAVRPCIDVTFRFTELTEGHAEDFLHSVSWDTLKSHLAAASRCRGGERIGPALAGVARTRTLRLLTIEDRHTSGLTGPEVGTAEETGNFAALCRDELYSSKSSADAGGSHGIGKAVLWQYSAFSTVLFHSVFPKGARNVTRFIGRAVLPWHDRGGRQYNGGGWFGARKGDRAESLWGREAQRASAAIGSVRPLGVRGTSITIVGFSEPAMPDTSIDDVVRRVSHSCAKWFWPRMVGPRPRLRVFVEATRDGAVLHRDRIKPEQFPDVEPFARLATHRSTSDETTVSIPIVIPPKRDGSTSAVAGSLTLRAVGVDQAITKPLAVAYVRGAGMVVRYRTLRGTGSSLISHAVLFCGLAAGSGEADVAVDQFLRMAEPPEHDTWTATEALKRTYKPPYNRVLADIETAVRRELISLSKPTYLPDSEVPARFAERLQLTGVNRRRVARPPSATVRGVSLRASADGRWVVDGVVEYLHPVKNGWRAAVSLSTGGEDGGKAAHVSFLSFEAAGAHVIHRGSKVLALVPGGTTFFNFAGEIEAPAVFDSELRSLRVDVSTSHIQD